MAEKADRAFPFSVPIHKSSDFFAEQRSSLRKYIPELDGIRALAIISVVWHNVTAGHYIGGVVLKIINMFANSGWVGVQLFFVLSGFLITGILLDEERSPKQLQYFYMRRFLRILPLYYSVLCLAFIILPLLHVAPAWLEGDRRQQFWYWTFLINWSAPFLGDGPAFGHFWSLAVEEQFYLLWPLCVIMLRRRDLMWVCLFLIVGALFVRGALVHHDLQFALGAAYKFTAARWDALAVGALLALLVREQVWYRFVVSISPVIFWGGVLYIVVFMAVDRNLGPVGPGLAVLNQTVTALLFGVLIFYAVQVGVGRAARWRHFLTFASLRSVGKYSYAIYVFHLPMIQILAPFWRRFFPSQENPGNVTAFAFLVFAASYGLSVVSWYLLEQPCLRLKRFFVTRKPSMDGLES